MTPRPPSRGRARVSVGGLAVACVVLAVAVPVLAVAFRSVRPGGAWGLDAVARILGSDRTWRLVAVTVAQAAVSCAITLVVGVPLAWVLSQFAFPGRSIVRLVTILPFVLPSVVIGAAFASVLGPRGVVDLRGTWWPILAAHLCFNLAVVIRTVGAALSAVPSDVMAAGRVLGATSWGTIRRLALPLVAPALGAAAVIVFLFCLTSFGVIVILGGGSVTTIEVEIWTRATRQFDLSGAGVLAILQLLAVVATLAVHGRLTRRMHRTVRASGTIHRRAPSSAGQWIAVLAASAAVVVVSVAPLAALVERSLRVGGRVGLDHWRSLGSAAAGTSLAVVSPTQAVVTSLVTAAGATIVAMVVAVPAARSVVRRPGGLGDRVLLLPLGVSATTIGLGLLLAVGRPPVDLRRAWWMVPVAQALVAMPLVVRSVLPAMRSLPTTMLDAAATLGANPRSRWWRVELPVVRGAAVAGAGLAFVACLGEFGATVFLARADRPTVPVAIERLMSRPGGAGFGQAMALACVLAVLCACVVAAIDRVGHGDDGVGPTF